MGRIIEAKAVISAEDRTGAVFDRIAKKFKEVGKGAKVSAEIDRMSKALKGARDGLAAIDGYRGQRNGFFDARNRMRETKVAVEQASHALANAAKPTRALEQNLRRAQSAADEATRSYERQKTAVLNSRHALTKNGVAVSGLIAEQKRLGTAIDQGTAALERRQRIEQRNAGRREIVRQMRAERDATLAETARARAGASGNLLRGMGGAGRRQSDSIEANRRLVDGMGAPAREQAVRRQQLTEEQRQARQDATRTLAGMGGLYLGHKVHQGTDATLHTYRDFDKYSRQTEAFGNFDKAEMGSIIDMAIHGGATTRYNDIQWLQGAKALGGRGVKAGSVMGILPEAAQYGQAMSTDLPEAVAGLEGSLFTFRRDLSTPEKAAAAARRTADLQVGAAKSFGLTHHDLKGGYEYGGLGAEMSGLGEEKLLAFLGLGKKLNIDGAAQGNAFNAMTSKYLSPTRKGREALAGVGIDYSQYQKMPKKLSVDNFSDMVAQQYGVKLDQGARGKLGAAFSDKSVFGDASAFAVAVKEALQGQVGISGAKDANKVAGSAERFRQNNVEKVDVSGLMDALMEKMGGGNLALANAIFGEKQGKRVMAALRDGDVWKQSVKKIEETPDGKARGVADKMNAGYDGAMSRREGSIKNLETAIGRGWDDGGAGGFLTKFTDLQTRLIQGVADMNGTLLQIGSGAAWLGGKAATSAGTIALVGASLSLKGSAAALTAAAARIAGGAAVGAGASAAGTAGAAAAGGAAAGGLTIGGAITGGVIAGGAVAGGALDMATPGTNVGIGGLIFGGESSLEQTNRALKQERDAAAIGAPVTWGRRPAKALPGAEGGTGYSTGFETSRGVVGDFLYGKERSNMVMPGFGAGAKTIPVEVVSMRTGADPSGQVGAINNTLDKASSASATAANGGKPIEATVKPDQITAKIETLPPVSGEATVTIDPQRVIIELNSDMLTARIDGAVARKTAQIPLSSGGRPGAVSMPGAATTPGAAK